MEIWHKCRLVMPQLEPKEGYVLDSNTVVLDKLTTHMSVQLLFDFVSDHFVDLVRHAFDLLQEILQN